MSDAAAVPPGHYDLWADDDDVIGLTVAMTCPHCGFTQRARCREVGAVRVLPPCPGCGRSRGAKTQIEAVR